MLELSPGLWGRLEVDLRERETSTHGQLDPVTPSHTFFSQKSAFPPGKTMIFLKRGLPDVSQLFKEFIKSNT